MQDFEHISRLLTAAGVDAGPAEVHGILSALLCAAGQDVRTQWFEELFDTEAPATPAAMECRDSLAALHTEALSLLEDQGLEFTPLLPNDTQPLSKRAQELNNWCQGFLYGMGLAGGKLEKALSDQAREALRDLTEITRMDTDSVEESEAHEEALVELVEFIRVVVMLIYEELARNAGASA